MEQYISPNIQSNYIPQQIKYKESSTVILAIFLIILLLFIIFSVISYIHLNNLINDQVDRINQNN